MNILFCRIGWMANYSGDIKNDPIKNGGSYNLKNVGYEVYNFKNFGGKYYGFIEPEYNGITFFLLALSEFDKNNEAQSTKDDV
ncbi:MAG: hypothetical protein HFI49_03365, partial [Bacilli bacterium]|nr:hypothetical protein [Bacilli bacterium]